MIDRRVLAAFFAPRALGRRAVDLGRVLAANLAGARRPLFVQFLVTARCNLACRYCELPPSRVPELSDSRVEALLDDLCACGMRKVSFTGGEPLLRNALPAWIRRVQSRGVFANLITNGWYLEERAHEIAGVHLVMVSVDGRAEAHDSVRGAGSHERAIRALFRAARGTSRRPRLIVSWLDLGKPPVAGRADEVQVHPVHDWLGTHGLSGVQVSAAANPARYRCTRPWASLTILWDGRIATCCYDHDARRVLGDLRGRTVHDVWNSAAMREFRRRHRDLEPCRSCRDPDPQFSFDTLGSLVRNRLFADSRPRHG